MVKGSRKKPAAAPYDPSQSSKSKDTKNALFEGNKRTFTIGGDLLPKKAKDLTRYVRFPKVVRLARQKRILYKRLKVPPSINAVINASLDKTLVRRLVGLLNKYKPETRAEKKERLRADAAAKASGAASPNKDKKPLVTKFGLNHVTALVEAKKASLVVIAADVDPIELVVWLPALCRKMQVPYCVVRSKALLGACVGKKTAAAVALTTVRQEDKGELAKIVEAANASFLERHDEMRRRWGGGIMGIKSQMRTEAKERAIEKERLSRAQV